MLTYADELRELADQLDKNFGENIMTVAIKLISIVGSLLHEAKAENMGLKREVEILQSATRQSETRISQLEQTIAHYEIRR